MEEILLDNKAMWHKSCYNKFNSTKLKRVEKRKSSNNDIEHDIIPARKNKRRTCYQEIKEIYFFCDEGPSASQCSTKLQLLI